MREPVARSSDKSDGKYNKTGPVWSSTLATATCPISFSQLDRINSSRLNKQISEAEPKFLITKKTLQQKMTIAPLCTNDIISSQNCRYLSRKIQTFG